MTSIEDKTAEWLDNLSTRWKHLRVVAHADWSKNPSKCWVAIARVQPDKITIHSLGQIDPVENLLEKLNRLAGETGCALAGFDFPIGLPAAYADKAEIHDFLLSLPCYGVGEWADFYQVAANMEEISLRRPFYPNSPGAAKRDHLTSALMINWKDLYRQCELAQADRRPACPLFWTLGGQQVGKAAIHGWRDVLAPAVGDASNRLAIWPFSGELESLIQRGMVVALETYPAEFYAPLGIRFSPRQPGMRSGKRQQIDRRGNASTLLEWCGALSIDINQDIEAQILDGFGSQASGEDAFDALVGLIGMVKTLRDWNAGMEPSGHRLRKIEGWIFGQPIETFGNTLYHEQSTQ